MYTTLDRPLPITAIVDASNGQIRGGLVHCPLSEKTTDLRIAVSDIQRPWIGWAIRRELTPVQKTVGRRFLNICI